VLRVVVVVAGARCVVGRKWWGNGSGGEGASSRVGVKNVLRKRQNGKKAVIPPPSVVAAGIQRTGTEACEAASPAE